MAELASLWLSMALLPKWDKIVHGFRCSCGWFPWTENAWGLYINCFLIIHTSCVDLYMGRKDAVLLRVKKEAAILARVFEFGRNIRGLSHQHMSEKTFYWCERQFHLFCRPPQWVQEPCSSLEISRASTCPTIPDGLANSSMLWFYTNNPLVNAVDLTIR